MRQQTRLAITLIASVFCVPTRFRLNNGFVEVLDDNSNQHLPLCADSYSERLGQEICESVGHTAVKSAKPSTLASLVSISLLCDSDECRTKSSLACFRGIQMECTSQVQGFFECPPDWIAADGGRCVGVPEMELVDYDQALKACSRHNATLASLSSVNLKFATKKLITATDYDSVKLLTSAVRQRRRWTWADQTNLRVVPKGAGRCLALDTAISKLVAVECSTVEYYALCEISHGQECVLPNGYYDGKQNVTRSGKKCLKWSDPNVVRSGLFSAEQALWDHNYCRTPSGTGLKPWCMVSSANFEECGIPICNVSQPEQDALIKDVKCKSDEIRCGQMEQCVALDFICDYDMDCSNGFDEANCPDFLQHFDLVGEFKLVDEVSEVWTNIRHVQGCAQRCLQTSEYSCDSFSFDPEKEICYLSKESNNPLILFDRPDTFYYRRKISQCRLWSWDYYVAAIASSSMDAKTSLVSVSKLGEVSAAVCVAGSEEENVDNLCLQLGMGPAMVPLWRVYDPQIPRVWHLECLRSPTCTQPSSSENCHRFLRCSSCAADQFSCQLAPQCIAQSSVCNGVVDCVDATDEIGCQGTKWRMLSMEQLDMEGRIQLDFQAKWNDICSDGLGPDDLDKICARLGKGKHGRILPVFGQTPTTTTWLVDCSEKECRPLKVHNCINGILNLRCESVQGMHELSRTYPPESCGRRFSKIRQKRVVGGFDAAPGAFPWTAALRFVYGDHHHCGAVILSRRFLVTAAHCFDADKEANDFYVVVGDYDNTVKEGTEQKHKISKIHFYPAYEELFHHDIALIELVKEIRLNTYIQPICLPPMGYRYEKDRVCMISGWGTNGTTYVRRMQAAAMPIVDRELCQNVSDTYSSLSRTTFCAGYLAGGVDACQGDSGGPFACEHDGIFYLAGIISWGEGCAQKGRPGIYTMLTPYLSWIRNVTMVSTIKKKSQLLNK